MMGDGRFYERARQSFAGSRDLSRKVCICTPIFISVILDNPRRGLTADEIVTESD